MIKVNFIILIYIGLFYLYLKSTFFFFYIIGIRTFLLESEEHECPDCNEKDVSPETLIPNRFLRNAVMNFKNETGYAKRQTYRPSIQSSGQSAAPTDQPKVEVQQTMSQVSSQAQTIQSVAPNVPSQESVEPQSTNLESASQHFPTAISSLQPQTSTSKCFLLTDVSVLMYIILKKK